MIDDQSGRGFWADAVNAGNIVDGIAHQREHIAELFGRDTEFFLDLGRAQPHVLHRVEHVDRAAMRVADQLHQILVRTDDGDVPAPLRRLDRIGGDDIVGFQPGLFDAWQRERASGVADQRELRAQIFGGIGALGLVFGIDIVAEALRILVEDHRQMGRAVLLIELVGKLPQHGRIAINRAHRRALRIGERGQAVIGAEDIGRAIDEIEMLLRAVGIGGGLEVGIGHGRSASSGGAIRRARNGGVPQPLCDDCASLKAGAIMPRPIRIL